MFHMSHSTNIYGNFTKIHLMAGGLIVETSCVSHVSFNIQIKKKWPIHLFTKHFMMIS